MGRNTAKAFWTKQSGDPDSGFISALDAQKSIDEIYDDLEAAHTGLRLAGTAQTAAQLPASATIGDVWATTQTTPTELWLWDGSAWVQTTWGAFLQLTPPGGVLQTVTGSVTFDQTLYANGGIDLNDSRVQAVGTPTADTDAATKGYVDGKVAVGGYWSMTPDANGKVSIAHGLGHTPTAFVAQVRQNTTGPNVGFVGQLPPDATYIHFRVFDPSGNPITQARIGYWIAVP